MPKDNIREKVEAAARAALEKKAQDLVVLDVRELSAFTDYHIICHGSSTRQVQTISRFVEDEMSAQGRPPRSVEGFQNAEWVLLDFGDFIVHVFLGERRRYYDLEGLWGDAGRMEVAEAHGR